MLDNATPRPIGMALLMVYSSFEKTGYPQPLFSHLQNESELRMMTHAYNPRTSEVGCRRTVLIAHLAKMLALQI